MPILTIRAVAITRCGNFFGGGDLNWNRIVPGTIRSVLRGQRPVIRSDGQFIRDYFYVEDGAAVYMMLAEQLAARPELSGEAFNFSNEIQVTVLDLVKRILDLLDSELEPEVKNEASNEIRHQYLSAAKAKRNAGLGTVVRAGRRLAAHHRVVSGVFRNASLKRIKSESKAQRVVVSLPKNLSRQRREITKRNHSYKRNHAESKKP